jgi:hypothetical protein
MFVFSLINRIRSFYIFSNPIIKCDKNGRTGSKKGKNGQDC